MARIIAFAVLAIGGCTAAADPRAGGPGGGIATLGEDDEGAADEDCSDVELAALAVLQEHCVECHVPGTGAATTFDYLTDLPRLVDEGLLIPGSADESPLLLAATDAHADGPEADESVALARWVDECLQEQPCSAAEPLGTAGMLAAMRADLLDLEVIPAAARPFVRYFTLVHLHDAGACGSELDVQRDGLAKVLGSLSWSPQPIAPVAIDDAQAIYRVDLRDYDWDAATWARIVAADPYAIAYTREDALDLVEFTETAVPFVRADWFVAAATAAPLYYDLLGLPQSRAALEVALGVDIDGDVADDEVARAGFRESGVSQHDRVIERHVLPGGPGRSLWSTYDFASDGGRADVFAHPLDFVVDAQMHLFTLPNGLHGYMLTDGTGQRVDRLSDAIAIDLGEPDLAIVAGRSCMRCHGTGVIARADELREHVAGSLAFDDAVREKVERLHPLAPDLAALQQQDADRYAAALAELGVAALAPEPVDAVFARLRDDLDLEHAAAELGLPADTLLTNLGALPPELLPLATGTIKRDTFAALFAEIACTLELGETRACGASTSTCCAPSDTPGCSDPTCESLVCDLWPECCTDTWTPECATQARDWACTCD